MTITPYNIAITAGFVGLLCFMAWEGQQDAPQSAPDHRAVALAESLTTALAEATHNLQAWKAALDSAPRDTVVRRVVRYIARHDTAWRVVAESATTDTVEVVRWLAASDSTLRVVRDSLEGELTQCRYDAQVTADALAAKPSGYWRGVRDGAVFGFAGGVAACEVMR